MDNVQQLPTKYCSFINRCIVTVLTVLLIFALSNIFFEKFLFQLGDNFNGWYTYIGSLKFHFPKLTNFNAIIAVIVLAKELTIKLELCEILVPSEFTFGVNNSFVCNLG